jgi:hypothetical protein
MKVVVLGDRARLQPWRKMEVGEVALDISEAVLMTVRVK